MDSDSDKENYFSLYMKKKKKNENKKEQFHSNKRYKNKSVSSQKIKDDSKIKSALKLILESPEKRYKNKTAFSFIKSYLIIQLKIKMILLKKRAKTKKNLIKIKLIM